MTYRNPRRAVSFLIAGVILIGMAYLSKDQPATPDEPKDGPLAFFLFGGTVALIGLSGFFARIDIDAQGLRRRTWFGFVRESYPWDRIQSWKLASVPEKEDSAGHWYVEFELAEEFGPTWIWIKEGELELPVFWKFLDSLRAYAPSKQRLYVDPAEFEKVCSQLS